MNDLISREAVCNECMIEKGGKGCWACLVQDASTVDATPTIHGYWIEAVIERTMGAFNGYKCSICGHEKVGRACLYNYCPECGAKMDEVSK